MYPLRQIEQADKVASGEVPAWNVAPEGQAEAVEDDDGFEEVLVSCCSTTRHALYIWQC